MAKVDVFLGVVAEEEAPDNSACSSKIMHHDVVSLLNKFD